MAWAAVPFISSLLPSAQTLAEGAPVEVDVSKLKKGQIMTIIWQKKPVWVLHRTEDQLATLPKMDNQLKDPKSKQDQQPKLMKEETAWEKHPRARSIQPRYLVVVALCTHLQCIPDYRPKPGSLYPSWLGGFHCPCHGSHYDLAARVIKGSPAPMNLPVPPYFYKSDTLIRIGEMKGGKEKSWTPDIW